jgi:hypothetical protein
VVGRTCVARLRGVIVIATTVTATALAAGAVAVAQPTPAAPELVPGTPCTRAARACADLVARKAWLLDDGKIVRGPVGISIGAGGEDATPVGRFEVEWKNKEHVSGESGAPMPYSVFFAPGGIAFHEGSMKTQSRGCIRLVQEDAAAFYDYLKVGDEVQVHHGTSPVQ